MSITGLGSPISLTALGLCVHAAVDACLPWTRLEDFDGRIAGSHVWVRARMMGSRVQGNGCFLVLRQKFHTVQAVLFKGEAVSKEMVKYAGAITKESFVSAQWRVEGGGVVTRGFTARPSCYCSRCSSACALVALAALVALVVVVGTGGGVDGVAAAVL